MREQSHILARAKSLAPRKRAQLSFEKGAWGYVWVSKG